MNGRPITDDKIKNQCVPVASLNKTNFTLIRGRMQYKHKEQVWDWTKEREKIVRAI